jgi:glycosyltransferase involved in cell wall biosynthesis
MKGYEFALVAISRLRRAGISIRYRIFGALGDENERLQLLAAIRDLGLEDCVEVCGPCSRTEVREALRSTDVFLLASVSEGLSTATLEAMAMEVPVVVTDTGGMREAVTDGVEGLVVPSRDPEALAQALATLADDVVLRRELGVKGRVRVITDFELSQRAAAMREQYLRLVRAHADRAR